MRLEPLQDRFDFAQKMRRINIFKRLMLAFCVVILTPTLIIGFFSIQNLAAQNNVRTTDSARSGLRNLDTALSERLKLYNDLSYRLYLDTELKQLLTACANLTDKEQLTDSEQQLLQQNKAAIGDILLAAKKQNPYILNIEIVSEEEEYVCATESGLFGVHIRDLAEFRAAASYRQALRSGNLPFWDNTVRSHKTYQLDRGNAFLGQHVTHLRAINEPQGEVLGVIVINVSLDIFSDLPSQSDTNVSEQHTLLLGNGDLVTYLNANRNSNLLRMEGDSIQTLLALDPSPAVCTINGKEYIVTTISCDSADWTLASLLLKQEVQKDLYALIFILILIAATCLLLSLTMSYLVTISITRPIRRLCTAMKNVEISSDTAAYLDPCNDEVGLLGQDFNRMVTRNQELIHRVYAMELAQKEETLRRKQAELDALQMQINPHFLYNTLDIIRWQIIDEKQLDSKAGTMLVRFSNLLKLSTRKSQSLVALSEEIDHVKAYLEVVQFDLDYPITLNLALSASALETRLPKLTLQPLVENAILHAFSGHTEAALLHIFATETETDLFVTIQNNGTPLAPQALEQLNHALQSHERQPGHIGLMNVHDRIQLQFGESYGLLLSQNEQGHTLATIHLPHHRTEGADGLCTGLL